jgi:preprotein translocase subunit SecB
VFTERQNGEIKMNLGQRVSDVGENVYEVVLTVTVTATAGEGTAYLCEVAQAGLFNISGLNENQRHAALNTVCPQTLFPYAVRSITTLVADGGFPPLVLQPINFEGVYQQRMSEASKAQAGAGDLEIQGTA